MRVTWIRLPGLIRGEIGVPSTKRKQEAMRQNSKKGDKECKGFDREGHAHFTTFSCYRRRRLLGDNRAEGSVVHFLLDDMRKSTDRVFTS